MNYIIGSSFYCSSVVSITVSICCYLVWHCIAAVVLIFRQLARRYQRLLSAAFELSTSMVIYCYL